MFKRLFLVLAVIPGLHIISCGDGPPTTPTPVKDTDTTTVGTVTDIDGNEYKTVKIGNQWWMAENLRVTRYRNGDSIRHVADDNLWKDLTEGAYAEYDHAGLNIIPYGRLYNWYAVNDSRGVAPEGWRVATDEDWKELEAYIGIPKDQLNVYQWRGTDEGDKLKEAGTLHWVAPNAGATNEFGFSARPNGYRDYGGFRGLAYQAYFWTSTEYVGGTSTYGWARSLFYSYATISRVYYQKTLGIGIRCVKDE